MKPLLPILLLLAACDTGDRRLFTDMSEARTFHRQCLADGDKVLVKELPTGVEITCY